MIRDAHRKKDIDKEGTDLVAVHASHASLDGRDGDVAQVGHLRVLDEDAGEEADKVLAMNDRVRAVGRHGDADCLDELLLPEAVALRHFGGGLAVRTLSLSKEDGLC